MSLAHSLLDRPAEAEADAPMSVSDKIIMLRANPERGPILSPLRYPGSKRRLATYIHGLLKSNDLHPDIFIEPFAGGASVALQLLSDGAVKAIGLIDRDPLVAAFWKAVFFDTDWLVKQILTIEVSLEKWREFKYGKQTDTRSRAIACLFLNRTSFSGILAPNGGPLGGHKQISDYTISCRFPRENLVKRVLYLAGFRKQVAFVWNLSWTNAIPRIQSLQARSKMPKDLFYYLDPPFFEKAEKLYSYYFIAADHLRLRDALLGLDTNWLLSYDASPRIEELYGDAGQATHRVELVYSAAKKGKRRLAEEVIISNLPNVLPFVEGSSNDDQDHRSGQRLRQRSLL